VRGNPPAENIPTNPQPKPLNNPPFNNSLTHHQPRPPLRHAFFFRWGLELLTHDAMQNLQATGAPPYLTFILDLAGYGSHTLGPMGITQTLINVFQNHFPETMKRAVIINAPWMFRAVWAVVQAFLDPVVKSKIKMMGSKGACCVACVRACVRASRRARACVRASVVGQSSTTQS
jgi:hypothetical protein